MEATNFRILAPVFPAEVAIRAPNAANDQTRAKANYPDIGFRQITNGLVSSNRRVSAVIQEGCFFLPEAVDDGPWNIKVGEPITGGVLRQDNDDILVHVGSSPQQMHTGIFVGSGSPHNWFHWTIDTLPSIFLARYLPDEFNDFPILLPESVSSNESWKEPLDLVLGGREVKFLRKNRYTSVENLIWVDSPTSPGPVPLGTPTGPRFSLHGTAMKAYRDHMLERLGLRAGEITQHRRIFLARAEGSFRGYNQQEALKVAADFGFEPVYLETLSFKESVAVMLEARAVIGPHGAGWANALYCQPGTTGVMWTWDESRHDNWFANIGKLAGMEFSTLFTGSIHANGHNIDPLQLRDQLKRRIASD